MGAGKGVRWGRGSRSKNISTLDCAPTAGKLQAGKGQEGKSGGSAATKAATQVETEVADVDTAPASNPAAAGQDVELDRDVVEEDVGLVAGSAVVQEVSALVELDPGGEKALGLMLSACLADGHPMDALGMRMSPWAANCFKVCGLVMAMRRELVALGLYFMFRYSLQFTYKVVYGITTSLILIDVLHLMCSTSCMCGLCIQALKDDVVRRITVAKQAIRYKCREQLLEYVHVSSGTVSKDCALTQLQEDGSNPDLDKALR